ncbi:hypothetical protein IWQ60_002043 [Tieghemiomyces parasiticus]|uniref:Uncharacterized protein n=1 Tax=Tieghemiomyces parasiticus TaxID=78921 RepID=A0A9W8E1C0_9FUNG|nr:hypothetical protein IWQ60_002043 [Tieghemiomyces parasiticus]
MKGLPPPGPRTSRTADSPLIRPVLPGGTPPWAAGPPKPGPNIREFEVEIEEEVPVNTNPQVPEDVVKKYDEVMDEMKRVRGALGKRARRKRLLKFTEDITDDEADGPDGSDHGGYSLDRSRGDRHPYGETASIYSLDAPVSNGELERIVAESEPIDKFLSNSAPVTPSPFSSPPPTIQVFENLIIPASEAEAEPASTDALKTLINATERLPVSPSTTLAVRSTADLNAQTPAQSTVASPVPNPVTLDRHLAISTYLVRSKALSPVYHRTIPASQSSDLIETELERELMPMGLSPVDIPTSWFRSQPSTPRLFQAGPPKKLSVRNFTETDETSPTSPVILAQSLPTTQLVTQQPLPVDSGTNVIAAEVHAAAQSTPVSPVGRVPIDRAPTFSPGPVLARITVRPAPLAGLVNSPSGLSSPRSRQGSRSTIAVPQPLSPKTPAGEIKEVFESFNAANVPPAPTPLPVSPFQFADADLQAVVPPSSATTSTSPHLTDDAHSTLSEMASTHPTAVLRHVQQQHSAVNNIRPPASPLGTPSLLRTLSHRQRSHSASIASEHSFGVGSSFGHPSGSASRSSIPSSVVLTGVAEEEGDGEPVNARAQPTVVRLRRSCEVPISKVRAPSPPLSRSIPAVLHTAPTIAASPITCTNDCASPPYQVSPLPSSPASTAMSDCVAVSRITPPRIQTARTVIASTPGSPHPFSPSDAVGLDLDPSGSPVLQAQYPTTSFVESSLALSDAALSFSDFEPVDPTHNEYPTGYAPAPSAPRNHAFLSPALLGYQPNLGRPLRYSGTLPRKSNSTFASDYSQFSGGATSPPPATHVSLDIAREIAALDDQLVEFRTRRARSVSRSRADSQGERDRSALNFPAYDDAIAQVLASEAYTPHQQAAQIAEALDALLEDHARARGPGMAASDSPTSRPSSPDQSVGTGSPTGLGLINLTCHPDPSPPTSPGGLSGLVPYDIDQAANEEEEVVEGAEARLSTQIPSSPPSAPRLKSAVPASAGADDSSPSHPILEDYMPLAIPVHFQRLQASLAAMPPVSFSSTRSDESAGRRSSTISRPRDSPCAARSLLQSLESELSQELKKLRQSGDSASSSANDRPVLSPPFELPVERTRATGIDRTGTSRSNAPGDCVELPEERSVVSPVSSVVSIRSLASPIFRMSLDAAPTPTAPRRPSVSPVSSAAGEKAHRAAGPSGLSSSITSLESIMSAISADRASLASHGTSMAPITRGLFGGFCGIAITGVTWSDRSPSGALSSSARWVLTPRRKREHANRASHTGFALGGVSHIVAHRFHWSRESPIGISSSHRSRQRTIRTRNGGSLAGGVGHIVAHWFHGGNKS